MRFPEFSNPKSRPDDHDGIVCRDELDVGRVERPNRSQQLALIKFFDKADIEREIGDDIRLFSDIKQMVFCQRTKREKLDRFFRQEHHFDLMPYDENPEKLGEIHVRTLYPLFPSEINKPEHRVERIIVGSDLVYQAPGI